MEPKIKCGVILGRFCPIHNGHVALIEKAMQECQKLIVFVGTANSINIRNSISPELRIHLIKSAILEMVHPYSGVFDYIHVVKVSDLTNENDDSSAWGDLLYKMMCDTVTDVDGEYNFYYADDINKPIAWFKNVLDKVNIKSFDRSTIANDISATKIRSKLIETAVHVPNTHGSYTISDECEKFIIDNCPKSVYNYSSSIIHSILNTIKWGRWI